MPAAQLPLVFARPRDAVLLADGRRLCTVDDGGDNDDDDDNEPPRALCYDLDHDEGVARLVCVSPRPRLR